ncbi:MAG: heat-inducible transcriptional repressor HrcA [bacterium]
MSKDSKSDLGPRKSLILKAIITDYVQTAEPVGSEILVQRYELGVKPATVRNEMAEMAEMGYLYQPHTSAGRIPSDIAYRYYVDRLMQISPITEDVQSYLNRTSETGGEFYQVLAETCKLLARMTQYTSLATTLRQSDIKIRQVVLSPINAQRLLLVVVLSNGQVENRLLDAPKGLSIEDLAKASLELTKVVDQPLGSIATHHDEQAMEQEQPWQQVSRRAMRLIRKITRELSRGKVLMAGEIHMLEQPEFQKDIERLEVLLRALDEENLIHNSMENSVSDQVTVVIGEENTLEPMRFCSLIASRFYVGTHEAGTIGVLGPTRMRYEQAVSIVDLAARSLSKVLTYLMGN